MKRSFDLFISSLALLIFAPLLAVVALAIKLESPGPVFFRGTRVGKDSKSFRIFKFRTMVADAGQRGGGITHLDDPRITRLGRFLRRAKIDELPQLINIVRGEMSLVGPRPEDPRYVQYYTPRQRQVLSVRPGITSIASIRYRHEEELLAPEAWEKTYVETVLPAKLDLELNYLAQHSFGQDLLILLATLFVLVKADMRLDAWNRRLQRFELFMERYTSWVLVDALLVVLAYVLALLVRSLNTALDFRLALLEAFIAVWVYVTVNHWFGIYRRFWRYASAQEAVVLFTATLAATLLLTVMDLLLEARALPLGVVWLGGFFTFIFLTASRYRRRWISGAAHLVSEMAGFASGRGARVLIVGAGDEGQLLAWQLQNRLRGKAYQVVGFVDDSRDKHGVFIHNVPVHGSRSQIPELVTRLNVDLIIIAIPPSKIRDPRELLKLCRATVAQIKILPGLFDWLGPSPKGSPWDNARLAWEDVVDDDLLERTHYEADEQASRELIAGRVVMITGAAGSIGAELCRQLAAHQPKCLVLVDINESGLYDLDVELHAAVKDLKTALALADIADPVRLKAVFEKTQPQIVFHVAAYKHVPILEEHPQMAIRVNVLGTQLVHALARAFGVERFVLISSDKAVNPTNVLGLTKWLGELIITGAPAETMLSTTVRFGNVLGSRGSVVPTFERQIDAGGPITITHPEMTRYFLSLSEAVSLVLQAAAMTRGGDLYVLDMGVPVSIVDLAHRMIRARGLRPGQDIQIEFVGSRLGERMSEELVAQDEEKMATEHPSIFRIRRTSPANLGLLAPQLEQLVAVSENGAATAMVRSELVRAVELLRAVPLESGEWGVESGEWGVESGEWRVESGEWRVESGEWRVDDHMTDWLEPLRAAKKQAQAQAPQGQVQTGQARSAEALHVEQEQILALGAALQVEAALEQFVAEILTDHPGFASPALARTVVIRAGTTAPEANAPAPWSAPVRNNPLPSPAGLPAGYSITRIDWRLTCTARDLDHNRARPVNLLVSLAARGVRLNGLPLAAPTAGNFKAQFLKTFRELAEDTPHGTSSAAHRRRKRRWYRRLWRAVFPTYSAPWLAIAVVLFLAIAALLLGIGISTNQIRLPSTRGKPLNWVSPPQHQVILQIEPPYTFA